MRTDQNISYLFLLSIVLLATAKKVHGTKWLHGKAETGTGSSKASLFQITIVKDTHQNEGSVETTGDDASSEEDSLYGHNDILGTDSRVSSEGVITRRKRSVPTVDWYGPRTAFNEPYEQYSLRKLKPVRIDLDRLKELQRIKRIFSDYGYGSRLQAGENLANSLAHENLFDVAGPGKRSAEMTDYYMLKDGTTKDKRINADYGYGSRIQAGESIATALGRNGLFGSMGPGKRSNTYEINDLVKRIAVDFGYGSRFGAAENVAKSSSNGKLFGVYGPGKRNIDEFEYEDSPNSQIRKRVTSDYGYGSRMQAAEHVAQDASRTGIFGKHGPGKRSGYIADTPFDAEVLFKPISPYTDIAKKLAYQPIKLKLFGKSGSDKPSLNDFKGYTRSGTTLEADTGYGSRIQAGSQMARNILVLNDLFGSYGPGR